MGNNMGKYTTTTTTRQEFLKFDRVIDGESQIYIGIVNKQINPYSSQAIRIGYDGELKRLESFEQTDNCLTFNYESNTTMSLTKRNDEIIINVKEPENEIHIVKSMPPICREIFKPINFADLSQEYDKIPKFINPKYDKLR